MKTIGVILSGCGVYDGSEIQEAVSVLIALDELGADAVCLAPDMNQHHVVNHLTGEEMSQERNVRVEAARIARGEVTSLSEVDVSALDGLVLPGGFGAAKNLSTWAFDGPESTVREDVANLIRTLVEAGKPIAALCVTPVVVAKALEGTGRSVQMTLGTTLDASPYDVAAFHQGLAATGVHPVECALGELIVDEENNIITTPCYMMDAGPARIFESVRKACARLLEMASMK